MPRATRFGTTKSTTALHDSIVDAFNLRMAGTKESASDERRALEGIEMVFGVRIVHLQARSR